jgi:N-acetylmuramic acid 6-phosphate etherase
VSAARERAAAGTGPFEPVQDLAGAPTEERNPRTFGIDRCSSLEVLRLLNAEDALVPAAVARSLPELARAVDLAVDRLRGGGRVHYFGAGTSGRLGVIDAAELPPTFAVEPDLFVAHHAGGDGALGRALEGAEDDEALGAGDAAGVRPRDLALGLAASGRTPYVARALRTARAAGAATVLVSANPNATLGREVDVHVAVDTGPEAIAGSTRLKAGTAEKLVLHGFSTAVMVRLGRVWSNLMIGMQATNAKLRGRLLATLVQASGEPEARCADALVAAGGDGRVALVSLLGGVDAGTARGALAAEDGAIRAALTRVISGGPDAAGDGHPRRR